MKGVTIMPVGAMIFLGVILLVFTALDIFMLVSLLKPGDERNQIIVWKASSFTLLATIGSNMIDVIENFVKGQYMSTNPFIQLEVAAILFLFLSCIIEKNMEADMENVIRNRRKELKYTQAFLSEYTGLSVSFISDVERGKPTVEIGKVIQLISILGLDINIDVRGR